MLFIKTYAVLTVEKLEKRDFTKLIDANWKLTLGGGKNECQWVKKYADQ